MRCPEGQSGRAYSAMARPSCATIYTRCSHAQSVNRRRAQGSTRMTAQRRRHSRLMSILLHLFMKAGRRQAACPFRYRSASPQLFLPLLVIVMHVPPVFALKEIGQHREYQQEDDDLDTQRVAHELRRLTGIDEEVDQITCSAPELGRFHAAFLHEFELRFLTLLGIGEFLIALQWPENPGHG